MSAADYPLLIDPDYNVTTFGRSLRSSPPTTFARPLTPIPQPYLTLHSYRRHQHSPLVSSSPDYDFKRVRRKPSSVDLGLRGAEAARRRDLSEGEPLIVHSSHENLSSLLRPPPSTPQPHHYESSPSLSGSVTTFESSPTHTPTDFGSSFGEQRPFERSQLIEPIRSKRKFSDLRTAKRLPHRSCGVWQVHAVVSDVGGLGVSGQRPLAEGATSEESVAFSGGDSGSEQGLAGTHVIGREATAESASAVRAERRRRRRAVRFEGLTSDSSLDEVKEKDPTATSTYTLSKFQFPAPPGHNWTGTFGHLNDLTPPQSPATLHYRGASFDVVNPHASLILGANDFETPAEIDHLLDGYFEDMESRTPSRVLYTDADSARRNIMRLEESPPPMPTANRRSERSARSARSDPFDLTVSDVDPNEQHENDSSYDAYEDGASAHATDDSTLGDILNGYEYTHTQQALADLTANEGIDVHQQEVSIDRGRGAAQAHVSTATDSTLSSMTSTLEAMEFARQRAMTSSSFDPPYLTGTLSSPPNLPTLPPPAVLADQDTAPPPYYDGFSEVPTSEQTYGNTGQLLGLTSPYVQQHFYDREQMRNGSPNRIEDFHAERFLQNESTDAGEEDKENQPPPPPPRSRFSTTSIAHYQTQRGIPETWSDVDVRGRSRTITDTPPSHANVVPRSSSCYPEIGIRDDAEDWETQVSVSDRGPPDGIERPSEDSIANVSDLPDDGRRSSLVPEPTQQISTAAVRDESGSTLQPASITKDWAPDGATNAEILRVKRRAYKLLKAKLEEQELSESILSGTPSLVSRETRRAGLRMLVDLKQDINKRKKAQAEADAGIELADLSHNKQKRKDAAELEYMRRKFPTAVRAAAKSLAEDTQHSFTRIQRFLRPSVRARNSFDRAIAIGQGSLNDGASDRRGLISGAATIHTSSPHPSLQYSETDATFATLPKPGHRFDDDDEISPVAHPSPLMLREQRRLRAFDSPETLRHVSKGKGRLIERDMPAMSSQRSLRTFRSTASLQTGPLTDQQLMEAEPGWSKSPKQCNDGIYERYGRKAMDGTPSTLERGGRLLHREDNKGPGYLRVQHQVSK